MENFNENKADKIKNILSNLDLELTIESPDKNFLLIYSTSTVAQEIEHPTTLTRKYWIHQKHNASNIQSPWDDYDEAKQITLATNIITFSNYRIKSIYSGWQFKCPLCNTQIDGKIWRNTPKRCNGSENIICNYMFKESDREMVFSEIFND